MALGSRETSVAIIGNGPAALFLSFILSGNTPFYDPFTVHGPHPDPILDQLLQRYTGKGAKGDMKSELKRSQSLLDAVNNVEVLDYISRSYTSFFSSDTSPINLLIDTLISSDETSFMSYEAKQSRIRWQYIPAGIVPHTILGSTSSLGGQWASQTFDEPDQQSLSYAEMLSLPGYSFSEFYKETYGDDLKEFSRPFRRHASQYFTAYAPKLNLKAVVLSDVAVTCVDSNHSSSYSNQYIISYTDLRTRQQHILTTNYVVLATGVSDRPRPVGTDSGPRNIHDFMSRNHLQDSNPEEGQTLSFSFESLDSSPEQSPCAEALPRTTLVVGTGVSAAEAIDRCPQDHCVIHLYKWDGPTNCVLRKYSRELYPEYFNVYQMMRKHSKANNSSDIEECYWQGGSCNYEGVPNGSIKHISPDGIIEIILPSGKVIKRRVVDIKICTGRSGSLDYLSTGLCTKIGIPMEKSQLKAITKSFLKPYLGTKALPELHLGDRIYAIGSLTGDTLIRFILGGCMWVAGDIQKD